MRAYELAKAEIGTVEWQDGSNPKVLAYFRDAGHPEVKDDATAWCAAFVGAMLHRAGLPNTGKLTARSYLEIGRQIDRKDAQEGDLVIFERGGSTWQGHVGFFVKDLGDRITVLGGNQANAVSLRSYDAKGLLGIRRIGPGAPQKAPPSALAPSGGSGLLTELARLLREIFGGGKQ